MRVTIDATALDRLSKSLGVGADVLARAQFRAINKAAEKGVTASRRAIASEVALTQAYIRDRMALQRATAAQAVAVIRARKRATTLARFSARQLTRSAPGAKGDARRGIGSGRKQGGVSVKVKTQGPRKAMPKAFLIPLRAGGEAGANGFGVFTRQGRSIRHRYGPSVDQVFRSIRNQVAPGIAQDLEVQIVKQLQYELGRAFK